MAKKRYVVRVVIPAMDEAHSPPLAKRVEGPILECLRYAGVVTVHTNNEDRQTFDIHCPAGITDTQQWAEKNAERMTSFGYNAVCAPSTEEPPREEPKP